MTTKEYVYKFEELGKYFTFFYHPDERIKYIKFEDGFMAKLKKVVGILEIFIFLCLFTSLDF